MKTLEELASPSEGEMMYAWETELVKQQLYNTIRDAMYAKTVGRQLLDVIPMKAGHAMDFVLEDAGTLKMRFATEGATLVTDVESYTKRTITPIKYGCLVTVSQEIREDANWNVVQRNLRRAGTQAALTEDYLVFNALNDGTYGVSTATSAAGTSHNVTSQGTEMSIYDIAMMMKVVEEDDYVPNVLVIHPTQVAELRQIDTFVEADKVGSDITFQKGFVGKIYGMDVVKTTKAWVDQVTTQYAWCLDAPEVGVLVVRRPLTMRPFEIPERDVVASAVTIREEAGVLMAKAGSRLTIS